MLVYPLSRSLQWEQAQKNKSCFWLQHGISRKITKQRTYAKSSLNNQITGVLIRFRQEPIAIMADIKLMFDQVHVQKNNKT